MFLAPDAVTAITKLTIVRTSTHRLPGWRYRSGRSPGFPDRRAWAMLKAPAPRLCSGLECHWLDIWPSHDKMVANTPHGQHSHRRHPPPPLRYSAAWTEL